MPLTLIGYFLFSAIMQMTSKLKLIYVVLEMPSNEAPFVNNRYVKFRNAINEI